MANSNGRQVAVVTRFQTEAIKSGGVDRMSAQKAAEKAVADLQDQVHVQVGASVDMLVGLLRNWAPAGVDMAAVCERAAAARDLAGLANRHLLTEVAMHVFDSLDAVAVDGATMTAVEAVCFADALTFAQQDLCRGTDLTPYRPLLKELEALTSLVIARAADKEA